MSIDWEYLAAEQKASEDKGRQCVAGAVIFSPENKVFVQKRAAHKRLYPNCWDVVGGHVETGESLQAALEREIFEETGWKFVEATHLVQQVDWAAEDKDTLLYRREFDFIVTVEGDLSAPQIETENFTECRWISEGDLELLNENRVEGEEFTFELVKQAFALQK